MRYGTPSPADQYMATWRLRPDILLVEDDAGHAELIMDILKQTCRGMSVCWFKDGQAIIDFLSTSEKDIPKTSVAPVLILDIRIPKIDGVEVLKRVKHDARLKSMPVIMLTTTDDPEEIAHCYRQGCNAYICKPVDIETFTKVITSLGDFIRVLTVTTLDSAYNGMVDEFMQ